jgi:uncharacterized damage-inducible protein DinB
VEDISNESDVSDSQEISFWPSISEELNELYRKEKKWMKKIAGYATEEDSV